MTQVIRCLKPIVKYKNYPSVRLIKKTFKNLSNVSFHYLDESDVDHEFE